MTQFPGRRRRILSIIAILIASKAYSRQASTAPARLGKIEITGLLHYTQAQVIDASGLKIGQNIDADRIKAAAKEILNSGLFKKVVYRYRFAADQLEITFEVEELGSTSPCIFDNFVWFTDDEITEAIRRKVPSFDGSAPESGPIIDNITKVLEGMLQERKIPGQVDHTVFTGDIKNPIPAHVFRVNGHNFRICAIRLANAAAAREGQLAKTFVKAGDSLIETNYSRQFVALFVQNNLVPAYQQQGYLRASFLVPQARLEPDSAKKCSDGVAVTLGVEEGLPYVWDKAVWEGNEPLSVENLDALLGMKSGEPADGLKIQAGLENVKKAYGRRGFTEAKLPATPVFEDTSRRVRYQISVNAGPQYRMGQVVLTGLQEKEARQLRGMWRIQPGDVYDAAYMKEFLTKVMEVRRAPAGAKGVGFETTEKPDRETLTVDVMIHFK